MGKLITLCILLVLAAAIGSAMAVSCASLIPTSFGFPAIVQKGTTTAFSQDTASATDLESINIGFPMLGDGQSLSSTGFTTGASGIGSLDMFNSFGGISPLTSMFSGTHLISGL